MEKICLNCGLDDPQRSGYCDGLCWEAGNSGWPRKGYKWPKSYEKEEEEEEEEEEEAVVIPDLLEDILEEEEASASKSVESSAAA